MTSKSFYTAWAEVAPDFSSFGREVDKGFRDTLAPASKKGGEDAGDGIKGGMLGSVAKIAGPLAAAFAAINIGSMVADTITEGIAQASDLEQSIGAIETVFKGGAADMLAWSNQAASSVGLTKNEFNELGTLIGSQLKNGGTAMDQLAPKTNDLITLGSDLSSMFGGTTREAVEALSSALKGERDPIERYGVSLNQAAIDAKAAELGFTKVGGALSAEANQAATLALIMDQTADAHGNFAKESDTLAHQQQVLAAGWTNIVTQIGQLFLPVMTDVVGMLNTSVIPALSAFFDRLNSGDGAGGWISQLGALFAPFADAIVALLPDLLQLWSALSPVSLILQVLQPMLPLLVSLIQQFAAVLAGALTAVLPVVASLTGQLASILSGVLAAVLPVLVPLLVQLASTLGGVLVDVLRVVGPLLALVASVIGDVLAAVLPLVMPLVAQLAGLLGDALGSVLESLAPLLVLVAQILADVLAPILPAVGQLLIAVLVPAVQLVAAVINALMPIIFGLVTILQGVIDFVTGVFTGDWDLAWSGIQRIFDGFVQTIGAVINGTLKLLFQDIPTFIGQVFSGIGGWLEGAGGDLIMGFVDGIRGALGFVGDAMSDVMDFIGGFFPHSPAKRGPFSGAGWTAVGDAGKAIYDEFLDGFTGDDLPMPGIDTSVPIPRPAALDDVHDAARERDAGESQRPIEIHSNDPDLVGTVVANKLRRR